MITLAVVSLFSPYAPATCAERLAAVIGPPGPTLAATFGVEATKRAYGTVDASGATLFSEQAGVLGRRNTPSILRAGFSSHDGGTLITGSVEPPESLSAFFVVFALLASVILISIVRDALQATPVNWHQVQLACLFPVFGAAALWFGKHAMGFQAQLLIDILRQTLDANSFDASAQTSAKDAAA